MECYPGWKWYIECTWESGCVVVKNLDLHGDYGFVIELRHLLNDTSLNLPVNAGGELLERCNLPRGAKPENFKELVKKDVRGQLSDESMDKEVFGGEY